MLPRLQILGLALVAMLALADTAANSALAAAYNSESSTENAIWEGSQEVSNNYTFETGVAKCTSAVFTGTQSGKATETLTLHPTYSGCKFAGIPATAVTQEKNEKGVVVGECNYVFTRSNTLGTGETRNWAEVKCSGTEKAITIKKEGCTVSVGPQTFITTIKMNTQAGPPKTVLVTLEASNIEYTETGTSCARPGFHVGGQYSGTVLMKGFVDIAGGKGSQTGIFVE